MRPGFRYRQQHACCHFSEVDRADGLSSLPYASQSFLPLSHENAAGETHDGLAFDSVIDPERNTLWPFKGTRQSLVCLLALRNPLGTQPQRDVGWRHRLPYYPYQVIPLSVQVRLAPELGRAGFQRVFTALHYLRYKLLSMKVWMRRRSG
jgi:hypothetical protein